MNKRKILTVVSLVLVSVVLVAAVPMAQSDLVSLTIDNQTHDYVTFRLEGTQFYYLMVQPYTSATFTIQRGDYTIQKFYSCGTFVNTIIDFTKKQTIIVPKCGDKAYNTPLGFNPYIDAGRLIKLVKVTFENPYDYTLLLILEGPAEYVFTIEGGNSESYTIAQGDYEVTQYGCAYLKNFNFYPYANKVKELTCSTVY